LVAKGYTPTYKIDYEETCAPIARMNPILQGESLDLCSSQSASPTMFPNDNDFGRPIILKKGTCSTHNLHLIYN